MPFNFVEPPTFTLTLSFASKSATSALPLKPVEAVAAVESSLKVFLPLSPRVAFTFIVLPLILPPLMSILFVAFAVTSPITAPPLIPPEKVKLLLLSSVCVLSVVLIETLPPVLSIVEFFKLMALLPFVVKSP